MELHEHSCCDMQRVYKGAWTPEEDAILTAYMEAHANECRSWKRIATDAGLRRCGKSCRFRWLHYLHPSLDRRSFSLQEVQLISNLHRIIGNKWAEIAKFLPGRSDNSIKNFWNAYCKEPYPSIQHQQQQLPVITTTLTNNQQILQEDHNPSTNYDLTPFPTDQFFTSRVIIASSINHQSNFQDFDPPSINYDLAPLPESFTSPIVNTPLMPTLEIGANRTYDNYNLFNDGISSGWMDPSYSRRQYLESSYAYDLSGTQDQNHRMGNSFIDHTGNDLNNHDLMEYSEANTSNNVLEGYSGTDMVAQLATDWDLDGFIGENYSVDPYVPFNYDHRNF